jgi:hypothetical protein
MQQKWGAQSHGEHPRIVRERSVGCSSVAPSRR